MNHFSSFLSEFNIIRIWKVLHSSIMCPKLPLYRYSFYNTLANWGYMYKWFVMNTIKTFLVLNQYSYTFSWLIQFIIISYFPKYIWLFDKFCYEPYNTSKRKILNLTIMLKIYHYKNTVFLHVRHCDVHVTIANSTSIYYEGSMQ